MLLTEREKEEIDRKIRCINSFNEIIMSWAWKNNQFCVYKRVIDSYCFVGTYTYNFLEFLSYLETEIFIIEATKKTFEK